MNSLPKNLSDAIKDFENYLNEQDLLPLWKNCMDVVNCAGYPADIIERQVYMCPAEGGAYNHDRCMYFGMYRNKKVEKVALIEAVVDVISEEIIELKWKNVDIDVESLKRKTLHKVKEREHEYPTRAFLLTDISDTSFIVKEPSERIAGLTAIMHKYSGTNQHEFDANAIQKMTILKITTDSFCGKRLKKP